MTDRRLAAATTDLKIARSDRKYLCGGSKAHAESLSRYHRSRRQNAKAVIAAEVEDYEAPEIEHDSLLQDIEAHHSRNDWSDYDTYEDECYWDDEYWYYDDYERFSPSTNINDAFEAMEDIKREQAEYECWTFDQAEFFKEQDELQDALDGKWLDELNPKPQDESELTLPTLSEWHSRKVA